MSRRQDFNPRLVQRNVRGLARPLRGRLESEALFALGRYRDRADVGNRFETIWRRLRRVRDEHTKRVSRRRTRRMASADEKTRLGEDGRTDGRRGENNKSDDDDDAEEEYRDNHRCGLSRRGEFRGCRRDVASARTTKNAQTNEKEKRMV